MNGQPQQIQLKAKEEDLKGVYSNLMQITHSKEEFVLDFFLTFPPTGILASRVIMSPGHIKRLISALQKNVEMYEGKFGKIEEAEMPEAKIGFGGEK